MLLYIIIVALIIFTFKYLYFALTYREKIILLNDFYFVKTNNNKYYYLTDNYNINYVIRYDIFNKIDISNIILKKNSLYKIYYYGINIKSLGFYNYIVDINTYST